MNDRRDEKPQLPQDEIALRAYELYCEQDCEDGHDIEHWLQAETEITGRQRERQGVAAEGLAR